MESEVVASNNTATEEAIEGMLHAVGLSQNIDQWQYHRSFDELDLDSLARMELASRIKERFGVDLEQDVTGEISPYKLKQLVIDRISKLD